MESNIYQSFFVQKGSSQTYRVFSDDLYVLRETWEGKKLLGTTSYGRFPDTPDGRKEAEDLAKKLRAGVAA